MIKNILENIHQIYRCKVFTPTATDNIQSLNTPTDYKQLLEFTDGFISNGVEFFGLQEHERPHKHYTLPSIETATTRFSLNIFFKDKTIIGQMPETIIYYDTITQTYGLSDRTKFFPQISTPSLYKLLEFIFPAINPTSKQD